MASIPMIYTKEDLLAHLRPVEIVTDPGAVIDEKGHEVIRQAKSILVGLVDIHPTAVDKLMDVDNHGLKSSQIKALFAMSKEMGLDRFFLNGDPLVFSEGKPLSGRVRLMAARKADKVLRTFVIWGIDPSVASTIDTGRKRTYRDVISLMRSIKASPATVKAVDFIYKMRTGSFPIWVNEKASERVSATALMSGGAKDGDSVGHQERFEFISRSATLRNDVPHSSCDHGSMLKDMMLEPLAIALHFAFASVDPAKADAFFNAIATSDRVGSMAPAVVRDHFAVAKASGRKVTSSEAYCVMVTGWKYFLQGIAMPRVSYTKTRKPPVIANVNLGLRIAGPSSVVSGANSDVPKEGVRPFRIYLRLVSPAFSNDGLTKNPRNRSISELVVEGYGRDIVAGCWLVNGNLLVFDWFGNLVNGQHRLTACSRVGVSFWTFVVEGVDPMSIETLDLGRTQSFGTTLTDKGYKQGQQIQSLIGIIATLERRELIAERFKSMTNSEMQAVFDDHSGVYDSLQKMLSYSTPLSSGAAYSALVHYIASLVSEKDVQDASAFFEDVFMQSSGYMAGSPNRIHDPILKMRERLTDLGQKAKKKIKFSHSQAKNGSAAMGKRAQSLSVIYEAFSHHRLQMPCRSVHFNSGRPDRNVQNFFYDNIPERS